MRRTRRTPLACTCASVACGATLTCAGGVMMPGGPRRWMSNAWHNWASPEKVRRYKVKGDVAARSLGTLAASSEMQEADDRRQRYNETRRSDHGQGHGPVPQRRATSAARRPS